MEGAFIMSMIDRLNRMQNPHLFVGTGCSSCMRCQSAQFKTGAGNGSLIEYGDGDGYGNGNGDGNGNGFGHGGKDGGGTGNGKYFLPK